MSRVDRVDKVNMVDRVDRVNMVDRVDKGNRVIGISNFELGIGNLEKTVSGGAQLKGASHLAEMEEIWQHRHRW